MERQGGNEFDPFTHDANLRADATGGLVQFSGPLAKVPGDGQVDRQEESYPWP